MSGFQLKLFIIRKVAVIWAFLILTLLASCVSIYNIDEPNNNQIDISQYIIRNLRSKHKSFLNKTNVIIITQSDSINNNEFIYGIYDIGSVQDIEVRPDSIGFSFKNFKEIDRKLFVYESQNIEKKPSEIYEMLHKYNVRLDSCSYKYRYVTYNLQKHTDCSKSRKSHFTDNDFSSIYYKVYIDKKLKKIRLKQIEGRKLFSY
ncbi:hypothetical protein [Winogradskyella ouciana]|uniref:hypothetical protein n=1 Tax=Winogradskyella ouciana TaxID=2608631 RepID=UPI003D26D531